MSIRSYVQLMKLRIGLMVALMAVMGYVAVADKVDPVKLAVLSLAMLLGSASSSVFNHFYDRDIDLIMKRTRSRPLASGQMARPANVLWFAAALLVSGCGLAALYFNLVVALHLFLGIFFYAIIYTVWLKRRHWINIVIGGAAGSFAVLAGAAAVDPSRWLLPVVKGDKVTSHWIFGNSILLVASSLLPVAFHTLSWVYGTAAALLGAHFLWTNWKMVREQTHALARKNFLESMLYLVGLFIAVLVDVNL